MADCKHEMQEFSWIEGLTHTHFTDWKKFQEWNNLFLSDDFIQCWDSLIDTTSIVFTDLIIHSVDLWTKLLCFWNKGWVYKFESDIWTKIYQDTNNKSIIDSAIYWSYIYWTTDTYCSRVLITNIDDDITADVIQAWKTFDVVNNYHYITWFYFWKLAVCVTISNDFLYLADWENVYKYFEEVDEYTLEVEFSPNEIVQKLIYSGDYIYILTSVDWNSVIYNWNWSSSSMKPVKVLKWQEILHSLFYRWEMFLVDEDNKLILDNFDDELLEELALVNPFSVWWYKQDLLFASWDAVIKYKKQQKWFAMSPFMNLPTNINTWLIIEYWTDVFVGIQTDATTYAVYKKSDIIVWKVKWSIIKNSNYHRNKMVYVAVNYELTGDSTITVNLISNWSTFYTKTITDVNQRIFRARVNEAFDDLEIEITLTPWASLENPKFLWSQIEYWMFTFL